MPGQPGAIRESRVVGRPRNPEVEKAWKDYASAFATWSALVSSAIHCDPDGFAAANHARDQALIDHKQRRDDALMHYFNLYDQDQREVFGA